MLFPPYLSYCIYLYMKCLFKRYYYIGSRFNNLIVGVSSLVPIPLQEKVMSERIYTSDII